MNTRYPDAAQLFAMDTAGHTMTVLHDDGLYRHLRFRRPDTSLYWFDIVTWPGRLAIHGDMDTYVFSRATDMVEFFATGGDINPGYWGEKVQGDERRTRAYSPDLLRQHVTDLFREYADDHGWVLTEVAGLWAEISEQILDVAEDEREARDAVAGFVWTPRDHDEDDEEIGALPGFRFSDSWDWSLHDFTHRFLWCCFAIQWAIRQYRAAQAVAA